MIQNIRKAVRLTVFSIGCHFVACGMEFLLNLFCSLAVLYQRFGHTMVVFRHLSLSSVILIDSSTGSPVHVLTLSIQAVHGLLACVHLALFFALSLSPGNSLVSSWCDHSMLASLLCLTVPSLLQLC